MSKISDELEMAIEKVCLDSCFLPEEIPQWLIDMGIEPGSKITNAKRIGNKNRNNKTDVIVYIDNSIPIKISAKLSSADYYGNWYGHKRFIQEFGEEAFYKLTEDITRWANEWSENAKVPYVGVSICFGKRTGKTARDFLDIFNYEDIVKIVAGYGAGDNVANCLYISSEHPTDINDLINKLRPINKDEIEKISKNFKVAYRPINPMTEYSNRGKNIYTKFEPVEKLDKLTVVSDASELFDLGYFVPVEPNNTNHNYVLRELKEDYNIYIPRKEKEKKSHL